MVFHGAFYAPESTPGPGDAEERMREMFGPHQVDQQISQAISTCWMMLPREKRNPDAVAAEIRRIVERALTNLKEDARAFGLEDAAE